jgi:hypothetical protein
VARESVVVLQAPELALDRRAPTVQIVESLAVGRIFGNSRPPRVSGRTGCFPFVPRSGQPGYSAKPSKEGSILQRRVERVEPLAEHFSV